MAARLPLTNASNGPMPGVANDVATFGSTQIEISVLSSAFSSTQLVLRISVLQRKLRVYYTYVYSQLKHFTEFESKRIRGEIFMGVDSRGKI